jgi:hypothetical protein
MWLDNVVSYYTSHWDAVGKPTTLRNILLVKDPAYMPIIVKLRGLNRNDFDYEEKKRALKSKLPAFALNELENRRGRIVNKSGLIQLDFDYNAIKKYDIEELKRTLFDLPFIAFCSRSCCDGFYALALIAEPEKQVQYAERCFEVLIKYDIHPDTSKGRNANDLRYVSYDESKLLKHHPEALKIEKLHNCKPSVQRASKIYLDNNRLVQKGLKEIAEAPIGNRWPTVQKWAFTLGGIPGALEGIIQVISNSSQYSGYEKHCIKCAIDQYKYGSIKPLTAV